MIHHAWAFSNTGEHFRVICHACGSGMESPVQIAIHDCTAHAVSQQMFAEIRARMILDALVEYPANCAEAARLNLIRPVHDS